MLIFGVLLYPESPRWLLKHGKTEEAAQIMANLHDTTPDDEDIRSDIDEINKLNAMTQGQKLTWKEFLSNGRDMNLWRASVACGSQAMQQIGGINLVSHVTGHSRCTSIANPWLTGHLLRHHRLRGLSRVRPSALTIHDWLARHRVLPRCMLGLVYRRQTRPETLDDVVSMPCPDSLRSR